MSALFRIFLLAGFLLACNSVLLSQDLYRIGLMPQVNVNLPLAGKWRLNTKLESRPMISMGEFGSQLSDFEYRLTDLSLLAARKFGPDQSMAGGYLLRSLPGEFRHRLLQQYAITQSFSAFRLGHRLISDQTDLRRQYASHHPAALPPQR